MPVIRGKEFLSHLGKSACGQLAPLVLTTDRDIVALGDVPEFLLGKKARLLSSQDTVLADGHSLGWRLATTDPILHEIGACAFCGCISTEAGNNGIVAVERFAGGDCLILQGIDRSLAEAFFHRVRP